MPVFSIPAIIVDPSSFFLGGLESCLRRNGHTFVSACSLAKALHKLKSFTPTLAIVGPNFTETDGLAICRTVSARWPTLKVILYSHHASDPLFQADAFSVGANACLPCNADESQTMAVMSAVLAGHQLFPRNVLTRALQINPLTLREMEVLKLMAKDKTDKEMAIALCLSAATVRNHSQHLLEKLGVHTRHEAVRRARRLGWMF